MAEYVDKEVLRNALFDADAISMNGIKIINNFPTADVAEVRHGKWIKPTSDPYTMLAKCSVCGFDLGFITNFCPNCGADMRGE